jgi:hypothetical protein
MCVEKVREQNAEYTVILFLRKPVESFVILKTHKTLLDPVGRLM